MNEKPPRPTRNRRVREIWWRIPPAQWCSLILRTGTGGGAEEEERSGIRSSGAEVGKRWACRVLSLPTPRPHSAPRLRVSLRGSTRLRENVAVLLKVAPLQHLDVMLVYLEGGAESDRQACQHVAALHQEQGLPVNFLCTNHGWKVCSGL